MSVLRNSSLTFVSIAALALTACGSEPASDSGDASAAASDEPAVIDQRQENFEALGDAFKAIRGQLETDAPDTAVILSAATDLNAAAQKIEGFFPEGTSVEDGYDTEALPAIWEKPEQFAEAHQMLVDRSAEMMRLAEAGDTAAIGNYVKELGGACKNCHDNFRLDDE